MELQTVLFWGARLACPLAMAVMLWLLSRSGQPAGALEPPVGQGLADLKQRRAALAQEIQALEAQASEEVPAGEVALLDEGLAVP